MPMLAVVSHSNHLRLISRWRAAGFTNTFQLYCTAGGLVAAALMLFAAGSTITRS